MDCLEKLQNQKQVKIFIYSRLHLIKRLENYLELAQQVALRLGHLKIILRDYRFNIAKPLGIFPAILYNF